MNIVLGVIADITFNIQICKLDGEKSLIAYDIITNALAKTRLSLIFLQRKDI